MLVVDASCVYEVLTSGPRQSSVSDVLASDTDWAAPHCMEAEVFGTVRRNWLNGSLDEMTAALAVRDLAVWPGRLIGHGLLLPIAWRVRHSISAWDALYVALAQTLDCPLVTLDHRLARTADITVLVL